MKKYLVLAVLPAILPFITSAQERDPKPLHLPVSLVADKIRGGLLGQMLGNLNGIPHEFRYITEPGSVAQYTPALPDGAWTDDDTDFEWVYILAMQRHRKVLLPYDTIATLWKKRINKNIWCSNRYARHLMDLGIAPPATGHPLLNPWASFNVSGQFLCETFGLLAPGMPQTAAKTGLHYTRMAIGGEPAQTTQLFTSMIATAFVERDINKILDAGITSIDPRSNTNELITTVREWHRQYPEDWKKARTLLRDRYTRENGGVRDRNGTELNTGAIILALLYGGGDFSKTLQLAFNVGWDADCNAATLGTILGVTTGYRQMLAKGWKITDRYTNTSRDNMPADETITSFADRLIELFELVNGENGGRREILNNQPIYTIIPQKPSPVLWMKNTGDLQSGLPARSSLETLLTKGTKREKAKAAYMAVCLGLHREISRNHPAAWREATRLLSGYWKVMNNIFSDHFKEITDLQNRFTDAGFQPLKKKYTDGEIYGDTVYWKSPETLY